jgi:hypothetical protein
MVWLPQGDATHPFIQRKAINGVKYQANGIRIKHQSLFKKTHLRTHSMWDLFKLKHIIFD